MNKATLIRCYRNYSLIILFLIGLAYSAPYTLNASSEIFADLKIFLLGDNYAYAAFLSVSLFLYGLFFALTSYEYKSILNKEIPRLSNSFLINSISILVVIYVILMLINIEISNAITADQVDFKFAIPLAVSSAMAIFTAVVCITYWEE